MRPILRFVLTVTLLLTACSPDNGLDVQGAWARPARQGENGAVYFLLKNHTADTHEVLTAVSDVAKTVEIHESQLSGDVMQMRRVESVSIGPREEVIFEPGGLHIMLIGLNKDLQIGDEIEVTLQFRDFDAITVPVSVQEAPADAGEH